MNYKNQDSMCDHKGHNPQNCPNRMGTASAMKTNPKMVKADPDYPKGNLKPGMSKSNMDTDND